MTSLLADLFKDLNTVFQKTESSWYVFGAQAAIIHGASRLTADIDITVMYGDRPVENLIEALTASDFKIRIADPVAFAERSRVVPVQHRITDMPVDIVLGGPGLEERFQKRARNYDIGGIKVPVATAEDVISMKILSGRQKDLDDVMEIVSAQSGKLNLQYIQTTLEMLEEALDRRDLLSLFSDILLRVK